jgi:hypothetical protein
MGWEESHLRRFRIKGREYGSAYLDAELETLDESQFRIDDLMKPGDRPGYEYDFGDGWEHELVIEASAERRRTPRTRRVPVARARARPRIAAAPAGSPTSRTCSPGSRAPGATRCAPGPAKTTTPATSA